MSKPSSSMDKPTTYLLLPSRPHDPHLLVFTPRSTVYVVDDGEGLSPLGRRRTLISWITCFGGSQSSCHMNTQASQ